MTRTEYQEIMELLQIVETRLERALEQQTIEHTQGRVKLAKTELGQALLMLANAFKPRTKTLAP